MLPFATVPNEPVPGVYLWGEDAPDVQVVFLICRNCSTIYTCNMCG